MSNNLILDDHDIKELVKAYLIIDELTDNLQSIYGDTWVHYTSLGAAWSVMYDELEKCAEVMDMKVTDLIKIFEEE